MSQYPDVDLRHDPHVAALLRTVEPIPPYTRVDWERLRIAILMDTADILARWRQRGSWVLSVARWSSATIPVSVLVGLAAMLIVAMSSVATTTSVSRGQTVGVLEDSALFGTVTGRVSAQTIADSITRPLQPEVVAAEFIP